MVDLEHYQYEYDYEQARGVRQAHRKARHRANYIPKKSEGDVVAGLVEAGGEDAALRELTYQASRHEREWILASLGPFLNSGVLTDVLRLAKGGKEASVYLCAAAPGLGVEHLAAKIYRPRRFRNLRNDGVYRRGRTALDSDGKKILDTRALHAMSKGTERGKDLRHEAWMSHEFEVLTRLFQRGLDVPRPFERGHNCILMAYIGSSGAPAPTLHEVDVAKAEVELLWRRLLWNLEEMLAEGVIHADLSPYNVLYHDGEPTVIDFPQAVMPEENPQAEALFRRDVARLGAYFTARGVSANPEALADDMWARYTPAGLWPTPDELAPPEPEEEWEEE